MNSTVEDAERLGMPKLAAYRRRQLAQAESSTETWVRVQTGDYAGVRGTWGKQFGTAVYVNLPSGGQLLCRVADVEILRDTEVRQTAR